MNQIIWASILAFFVSMQSALLSNAQSRLDPHAAAAYYEKAKSLHLDKNYSEAIFYYEKAIQKNDTATYYHLMQGKCYLLLGETPLALRAFQEVVRLRPDQRDSYQHILEIHKNEGDFMELIETLNLLYQNVLSEKDQIWAKKTIIDLCFKQKEFELAEFHVGDLLATYPSHPEALYLKDQLALEKEWKGQ